MVNKPADLQKPQLVKSGKKGAIKERPRKVYVCGCLKVFASRTAYWYHGHEGAVHCEEWIPHK